MTTRGAPVDVPFFQHDAGDREGAYHFFLLNVQRLEQGAPGFSRVHSGLRR